MQNLRLTIFGSCCLATVFAGYAAAQAPDLSGIYWATQYNAKIQIVGGGELPLTAAGKAAYDKNIAGLKDGSITDAAREYCVAGGLARVLAAAYWVEILRGSAGKVLGVDRRNIKIR